MSLVNQQIRVLAERIAASHGLDVVDLEAQGGGGKHRTLRIYLERNEQGRAVLRQRLSALKSKEADGAEAAGEHASHMAHGTRDGEAGAASAPGSNIVLDLVQAGELAGLEPDEDELAYLREMPTGVPVEQLSGITHGDCERFSRDFGTALDIEDLVPGAEYLLEASSPGLDRKLSRPQEFVRFEGQLCKLQTFTPVGGNRHWQGHLGPLVEERLTLLPVAAKQGRKASAGKSGAPVEIELANIEKAQLVPEF